MLFVLVVVIRYLSDAAKLHYHPLQASAARRIDAGQ
jgi:hypothetical protein